MPHGILDDIDGQAGLCPACFLEASVALLPLIFLGVSQRMKLRHPFIR